MVLKRGWAYFLAGVVLLILFFIFFLDYSSFRNFVNVQHMKFKEFVFLLNSVERRKKLPLTESSLRMLLNRYRLDLKGISEITNGYQIEIKEIDGRLLPRLIGELENYGRITEIEAIDNTGRGRFYLRLKITRS
ncbi:hypothetical protein [Aquifex sp.]